MRTVGIIAEYNPFHRGHEYQIRQARETLGADWVVAAVSGDFVQRGEPAVFDKYTRTAMALSCGADLVIELPSAFATGSAEDFAACGVSLLDHTGITDVLCFGSESGDLPSLQATAEFLCRESSDFQDILRSRLKQGLSFPAAREAALREALAEKKQTPGLPHLREAPPQKPSEADPSLLSAPNNILAIEYLKALKRRKSAILPAAIRRKGQGYHDTSVPLESSFASASFLRKSFRELSSLDGTFIPSRDSFLSQIPEPALSACIQEGALFTPVFPDDLSAQLQYRLLQAVRGHEDLSRYADVSPELADRLLKLVLSPADFSRRIEQLKTKQYTYTRISRALIHLLLNLTREAQQQQKEADYVSYIRILGFRKSAGPLLNAMKKNASLPIITKTANAGKLLSPQALNWFEQDLFSSHFYQSIAARKGRTMKNEYTRSVILYP